MRSSPSVTNNPPLLKRLLNAIEPVATTLWVGAHWAIGYIAIPILFYSQPDRQLAGRLAGEMFHIVNAIGLLAGALLLLLAFTQGRKRWRVVVITLMVVIVVASEFWLQPQMAALKGEGLVTGSAAAASFGMLHGLSSLLYLGNALMGLLLAATLPGWRDVSEAA